MVRARRRSAAERVAEILASTPDEFLPCRGSGFHQLNGRPATYEVERRAGIRKLRIGRTCPCGVTRWDPFRVRLAPDLATLDIIEELPYEYDYPPGYLRTADDPAIDRAEYRIEAKARLLEQAGFKVASRPGI